MSDDPSTIPSDPTAVAARWQSAQDLFWKARAIPAQAREAFLASACTGDAALRPLVDHLLHGDMSTTGLRLDPPSSDVMAEWLAGVGEGRSAGRPDDDLVGVTIGSCRIGRRIASGGMGVVYEAVQEGPARAVAVKVLRTSLAGDAARARFEREARILGGLRHRAVAQVYEAGTHRLATGERLPYFVLELVPDGRAITQYVRGASLSRAARVALLADVCDAVHAAHQKGVVHRDLKPSNVLVGSDGAPKVIDFGVASIDDPDGLQTATSAFIGTPAYMAPEQVAGKPEDVDTRSDVFALGLLAFEVLLDRPARDVSQLSVAAAIDQVRTSPTPVPRRIDPAFPRDLDAIVRRATALEPAERYVSAADMACDFRRFLASEPVLARPPGLGHALRLFARRRRALFAGTAIAAVALVAATIVSLVFAARETSQRKRAERLLETAADFVPWVTRDLHDEIVRLPGSTKARELLVEGVRHQVEALAVNDGDAPAVRAAAAAATKSLGDVEGGVERPSLNRRADARASYTKAIAIYDALLAAGEAPSDTALHRARTLLARGSLLVDIGELTPAGADLAAAAIAFESLARAHPDDAPSTQGLWKSWTALGHAAWYDDRKQDALAHYQKTLDGINARPPTSGDETRIISAQLHAQLNVGTTLLALDRAVGWEHLKIVTELARRLESAAPTATTLADLFYAHRAVGDAAFDAGRPAEAVERFRDAERCAKAWAIEDPLNARAPQLEASAVSRLVDALEKLSKFDEALDAVDHWVALLSTFSKCEPETGNVGWDVTLAKRHRGALLVHLARYEEARAPIEEAIRRSRVRVDGLPNESAAKLALSEAEEALGELELAEGHPKAAADAFSRAAQALHGLSGASAVARRAAMEKRTAEGGK